MATIRPAADYLSQWHLSQWHLSQWHLSQWHLSQWHLSQWHLSLGAYSANLAWVATDSKRTLIMGYL